MVIVDTRYNVLFTKILNMRHLILGQEGKLKEEFMPFQVLSIPDEAPMEITRMITTTKYGHSTLQMSMVGSTFCTTYDDKYNTDWEKCYNYLDEKYKKIYDVIVELQPERILTQGFVLNVFKENPNPISFLRNKIQILQTEQHLSTLICKFATKTAAGFTVNVQLSNAQDTVANAEGLLIQIETNDILSTKENNSYVSTKETAGQLLTNLSEIYSKLDSFIDSGVLTI
ncbi:MAG: hypothetical protein FWC89_05145 [Defluviitaleaceae bacterium]|nr:hypothetical protein [Defluviitaleaceae bacterium]